jgi:patatin-like phospholipase/acyl hydrolase
MAYQVLCLSGGGYRGLYTAQVLAGIEKETGIPFARQFDLIAGTSIGGIIALGLAAGTPAKDPLYHIDFGRVIAAFCPTSEKAGPIQAVPRLQP